MLAIGVLCFAIFLWAIGVHNLVIVSFLVVFLVVLWLSDDVKYHTNPPSYNNHRDFRRNSFDDYRLECYFRKQPNVKTIKCVISKYLDSGIINEYIVISFADDWTVADMKLHDSLPKSLTINVSHDGPSLDRLNSKYHARIELLFNIKLQNCVAKFTYTDIDGNSADCGLAYLNMDRRSSSNQQDTSYLLNTQSSSGVDMTYLSGYYGSPSSDTSCSDGGSAASSGADAGSCGDGGGGGCGGGGCGGGGGGD